MEAKVVDFAKVRGDTAKRTYEWAIAEQMRMGLICDPIRLVFKSDDMDIDRNGCVLSIFVDPDSGRAIYRRDWIEDMGIRYNLLLNFDEIRRIAPKSVAHMLKNADKIYRYYDGLHGGITRRLDYKDFAWVL